MNKILSFNRKGFRILNVAFFIIVAGVCFLPFIHLLALSFSSNLAAMSGEVGLLPVGFTTSAYKFLSGKSSFYTSLLVSGKRLVLGVSINMLLIVFTAYPLSKSTKRFKHRTLFAWFFVFTMFFAGGLIPTYIVVRNTGILNTIWALILPRAVDVWYVVMLLNFFKGIPQELEEAAIIDGASNFRILWQVYVPVALPAIATVFLFITINHWNSWFDGIIYMNSPKNYPLQSYLYTLVSQVNSSLSSASISAEELATLSQVSEKTLRTAQIFLAAIPVMMIYPFIQKYYVKGMTIGSVKG